MVVRCSNGVAFVVLEPEPSVRTGIRVEIYDGANPNTLLEVLQDSFGRRWTDPLRGPGSGSFNLYASDPKLAANPDLLAYGNVARFYLDGVPRFAATIEHKKRVQLGEDEDAARVLTVSGRGALAKLEEAQTYPAGGLAGAVERLFNTNAGDELKTLVDEAQARGALAGVTYDFTASVDSNNAPWDTPIDHTERAGTDLLRVAARLSEIAADVRMTPALVLQAFNSRGIDRSLQLVDIGPVVLQPADNLEALESDEDGAIRNALLVETTGGFVERIEGASVSAHRRREAFLSLGNVTASDQIDRAVDAVFERSANPAEAKTLKVLDKEGHRPYVDWNVGDWVLAPDEAGNLERFRVRAITVSEDEEGQPQFVPELATITEELEERLERWLAAMARGTMGGTAGTVAEPVKAPAEVVDAVDSGISTHVAAQPHPDELADLVDVDVTGLADDHVLRYDQAAGDWRPEALNLDALDDVDVSTVAPADGQALVFDDPSGVWVPGSVGGGGGGGAVPAWVKYLAGRVAGETAHADDVFFDGSGGGTDIVHASGTFDRLEAFGALSLRLAGASSLTAAYARAWPLTPSSPPVTIETRVTLLPGHLLNTAYGLAFGFSDGTLTTSNVAGRLLRIEQFGAETWNIAGTFAAVSLSDGINDHFVALGNPLHIRIGWTAANTFKANIARHPGLFSAQTWASLSRTLTPTHFWIGILNNQTPQGVLVVDYVRVNEANLVS